MWRLSLLGSGIFCREGRWSEKRLGGHQFPYSKEIAWMVSAFGEDKVLFGVDVPFSDMDVSIACVEAAPLSDREKEKIFWHNAAELLKIE